MVLASATVVGVGGRSRSTSTSSHGGGGGGDGCSDGGVGGGVGGGGGRCRRLQGLLDWSCLLGVCCSEWLLTARHCMDTLHPTMFVLRHLRELSEGGAPLSLAAGHGPSAAYSDLYLSYDGAPIKSKVV